MNNYENAREILGVNSDAIEADIKTAFRKKALSCHPDKHPNDPQAAEIFLQISQAQTLLLTNFLRTKIHTCLVHRFAKFVLRKIFQSYLMELERGWKLESLQAS